MNLSICVSETIRVRDIFGFLFRRAARLLPFTIMFDDETTTKEAEQKPIDNNSPPFVETLGVGITEEVKTKEAMG